LKSRASKKGGDERKKKSQRKCYECGEYGHFIVECPKNKNNNEEEKKYKEKSKEYKNKYQGRANMGQQCTQVMKMRNQRSKAWQPLPWHKGHLHHASSTTSPTMRTTLTFASWQGDQGTKINHLVLSLTFSSSTPSEIDDIDNREEIEAKMIKQFSKKGYKEIKRLLEKLEKKKVFSMSNKTCLSLRRKETLL
jgi:hypothetical protein